MYSNFMDLDQLDTAMLYHHLKENAKSTVYVTEPINTTQITS